MMRLSFRTAVVCLFASAAVLAGLFAAGPAPDDAGKAAPKIGRLTKEEQAALKPGLALRFTSPTEPGRTRDARLVRVPALHVPAGEPPTAFLPPGAVATIWSGYIKVSTKGSYSFQLVGVGAAWVSINGAKVLDAPALAGRSPPSAAVELVRGFNWLEAGYVGPANGPASFRLYWSGEGFDLEPLPPDVLFARADDGALAQGEALREGRSLFASRHCSACHALPGNVPPAEAAMPEIAHRGPSLADAGRRLNPAWIAKWIINPRALRPSATMPQALRGSAAQVAAQAADLAAYLAGLGGAPAPAAAPAAGAVEEGRTLFEKVGCLACHHVKEEDKADPFDRLPLTKVGGKFRPGALAAFLADPHEHHPSSRMPNFRLDAKESAAAAAYLADLPAGEPPPALAGDPKRGEKLFRDAGCISCHSVERPAKPTPAGREPPKPVERGCLAADGAARGVGPDFGLAQPQRQALVSFLSTDGSSLKREVPAEASLRLVKALQCLACHRRDGVMSRALEVHAEEGDDTVPEILPALSWTGQKLRPEWTEKLLMGAHDRRARPWLKARMPAFPAFAKAIAAGLSHEHGHALDDDPRPAHDAKLAEIGRRLTPQEGGLNCVNCHSVIDRPATAPFEAPGINLLDAALRLRYEHYRRWMMDPPRVDIATRMPKFVMDGKTTAIKDVFEGDARRQNEALWHYINTLPEAAGVKGGGAGR